MRKSFSLLVALLATLALALIVFLISSSFSPQRETLVVARVIDGDTFEARDGRVIRLANVNAPEKKEPLSVLSVQFLSAFEGRTLEGELLNTERYGRTLARLYDDGKYLNLVLVEQGLALPFLVAEKERKAFMRAELEAINNERGIWRHSPSWGCFTSDIDAEKETVTLKNSCPPLTLDNWTLKDESRKRYRFPAETSIATRALRIHTGKGSDTETELTWQSASPIWNNDADTLYLFDEEERVAHVHAYG